MIVNMSVQKKILVFQTCHGGQKLREYSIFIFVPEIRRVSMGLEQHGGVNYDHFHLLVN